MQLIVLDIETNIHTGYPVVITVSPPNGNTQLIRPGDTTMLQWLVDMMGGESTVLLGHNIAFDLATLQTHLPVLRDSIWSLYKRGRISDTMVREKLIRCAQGTLSDEDEFDVAGDGYSLAALSAKYLQQSLDKSSGSWRLRFHELENLPTSEWPPSAIAYCTQDVSTPRTIWHKQLEQDSRLLLFPRSPQGGESDNPNPTLDPRLSTGLLLNETQQCRAALALQLMTQGGISTDSVAVSQLEGAWTREVAEGRQLASRYFTPAKHSQTKVLFDQPAYDPTKCLERLRQDVEAEYTRLNLPVPRTDPSTRNPQGVVKTDEDTLSICTSPAIKALADMTSTSKLLTSFLPVLQAGTTSPLHPSYDILKATGRTSCYKPNIQQLPRKGGVRECFVPRPGYVFIEADYSQIELCALAQAQLYLLGRSSMADAIRQGKDLHLVTASVLLGLPYDVVARTYKTDPKVKEARQLSKAANFGYPGGMGPDKFVKYARVGYGLTLTVEQSQQLKQAWLRAYPEQKLYFAHISRQLACGGGDKFDLVQLVSGRIRGQCGFCDGSNSYFQGLAADGAKHALYLTALEAYSDSTSPLYGCVGGAFIHDEIILEAPADRAPQAAKRLGYLMVKAMEQYIPDVPIKAEPLIMRRLYKAAEPVFGPDGELIPWEPS
jgi:hypothetical protein